MSSKAKHSEPSISRTSNGKKRGVPPPSSNGENAQTTAAGISIEKDFYAWLLEQANAIRERRLNGLDWENIAEELEGMARSEKHALTSHLRVLLVHLLKWAAQSKEREFHLNSWRASIVNSRLEIRDSLEESPSLGNQETFQRLMDKAYSDARSVAAAELGLNKREKDRLFPVACLWTFAEFMSDDFLPDQRTSTASG